MENLTDLLKKSTTIKNEQGYIPAIEYLKSLINDNDLKNKDAVRCCKKIISFIKKGNEITITEWNSFFQKIITEKILEKEDRYEIYFSLSYFYYDSKEYDLSFRMVNFAMTNLSPKEYNYLSGLRSCFSQMAKISLLLPINEMDRSLEHLVKLTSSFLFEVASELGVMLFFGFGRYFDYREYNYNDDAYFSDGNFDSSLKKLGIFDKKNEIISQIHQFAIFEIPKTMGFPENVLNGDKKATNTNGIKLFENTPLILNFVNKLYAKYYTVSK